MYVSSISQEVAVGRNPALGHDLIQAAVGYGVAEGKEHRVQDHRLRIVHTFEPDYANCLSPNS